MSRKQKLIGYFSLVSWMTIASSNLSAAALQLIPSAISVLPGDSVTLTVNITGIGIPGAMEVGSFDLFIGFDPLIVNPTGVTFGPFLGDPNLLEALVSHLFLADQVEVAEISLLSPIQLRALQTTSDFTLATLFFEAFGTGSPALQFVGGPVDDAFGQLIAGTPKPIPEPGASVLLFSGLGLTLLFRHRISAV